MNYNILVGAAFSVLLVLIIWCIRGLVLLPVKSRNISMTMMLNVSENSSDLENVLQGLLWLRANGTLHCTILLDAENPDESTDYIARSYCKTEKQFIYMINGEIIDGGT